MVWGFFKGCNMRNVRQWLFLTLIAAVLAAAALCAGCKAV
jgi:hypothetical protein